MWEIDREYFVVPYFTSAHTAYQQASGKVHLYIMIMSNPGLTMSDGNGPSLHILHILTGLELKSKGKNAPLDHITST